ncbi:sphingomyelin phosphodiesterase 5 isoform X2 [Vombatus ursinus]|uniref:sphingomyelin phosphodiesterase n=1 Tax=Vombatus ursinus TaxID=29139 RepID=A0A4X2MEJ4_VOMUR|nr:sphingomyelin phosphodiesterase 5 isoform X2 [Vombatus ursinus]
MKPRGRAKPGLEEGRAAPSLPVRQALPSRVPSPSPSPMQTLSPGSPPASWPQRLGGLRSSPFPHPALHVLHSLARALLFPAYWALDRLLVCCVPTPRTPFPLCTPFPRGLYHFLVTLLGALAALLLLLAALPLLLLGLLFWLPLQYCRRPFCYQPPPGNWTPPSPWYPLSDPHRSFGFLSANLCLLPDGLARFSNLQHSQKRAEWMGTALLRGAKGPSYGATGSSPPQTGSLVGELISALPGSLDFVCLQETFDVRAASRLAQRLATALGPVIYDVGTTGFHSGPQLKLLGSGLLLVSRYPMLSARFLPFPNGRREDALASKGLLSVQVQLGMLDRRRIVGYLHCTHLHAPEEDWAIRCEQLSLLLGWAEQFEAQSNKEDDAVAFSVLMGDLNFDNCSSDDAQEQEHELFTHFTDPCRLGPGQEQPWAIGTLLSAPTLHCPVACSPEQLRSALEQEDGRSMYFARPLPGTLPSTSWQGRRIDYILYRREPNTLLIPTVERVTFSTGLAGLTDHLAVGLRLQVTTEPRTSDPGKANLQKDQQTEQ